LFALAAIWELWEPSEPREEESVRVGPIHSFSIITTDANMAMLNIHHRMPVIINPDQFDQWLIEDGQDDYSVLLKSTDEVKLKYHAVNTRVNSVYNNSQELVEPI